MDSSLWPAVPARSLLQHGFSTGCRFLQGTSTYTGSSSSCSWISAPLRIPRAARGQLPHHGLLHGLQETGAHPPTPSSPSLASAGLCLIFFLFFLPSPGYNFFCPSLNVLLLPMSPVSSSRSVLEPAQTGSNQHGCRFWCPHGTPAVPFHWISLDLEIQ